MLSHGKIMFVLYLLGSIQLGWAGMDFQQELATFTHFPSVDRAALERGEVVFSRQATPGNERGYAVQAVFLVSAPLEKTAQLLQTWNPVAHENLNIWQHEKNSLTPVRGDFSRLKLPENQRAASRLLTSALHVTPARLELQMSQPEAQAFASRLVGRNEREVVESALQELLFQRAEQFALGGLKKVPPYQSGTESIALLKEAYDLLGREAKIVRRFAGLLNCAASPVDKILPGVTVQPYWEVFDPDFYPFPAAVNLGVLYGCKTPDGWQILDVQHYASGAFYLSLIFYELYSINVQGKECTLIWRAQYLSSETLRLNKGVAQLVQGQAMAKEIEASIEALRADATVKTASNVK